MHQLEDFKSLQERPKQIYFSVCVRLQGAVLSLCAGTPVILLGYRDKCEDFMHSVESIDTYVDLQGENPLRQAHKTLALMLDIVERKTTFGIIDDANKRLSIELE